MEHGTKSYLYILGSLLLIGSAIGVTALINRSNSSENGSTDIRAKAAVTPALKVAATVTSVNLNTQTFMVANLGFLTTGTGNLSGEWTVTPPSGYSLPSLSRGMRVTLSVDPATFNIQTHTLTATEITIMDGSDRK
ncbi:MAG: hypothetical protein Q7S76_03250 [bacterium]|nr:hypothetical protein [bacterium]